MKIKIILIILFLSLAAMLASLNYFQSSVGPHNGIVKQAGEYNIEMKNNYPNLYAYLLDKKNNPVNNKGISCDITFMFFDNTSINATLVHYGEDGFILKSGVPEFYSCRIYFNVFGKTVSAKFENENTIAKKN